MTPVCAAALSCWCRSLRVGQTSVVPSTDRLASTQLTPALCLSPTHFSLYLCSASLPQQNLDSSEISLTDVSHYFDSDPTKLVQSLRTDGKGPNAYIADTTTANGQVRCAGWLGVCEQQGPVCPQQSSCMFCMPRPHAHAACTTCTSAFAQPLQLAALGQGKFKLQPGLARARLLHRVHVPSTARVWIRLGPAHPCKQTAHSVLTRTSL